MSYEADVIRPKNLKTFLFREIKIYLSLGSIVDSLIAYVLI
jgi:hypothetical protein